VTAVDFLLRRSPVDLINNPAALMALAGHPSA
jgi:hypothetical protein